MPTVLEPNLFAYGTLLFPEVMEAVTGQKFPSCPAVLEGYARFQVKGASYPGIVEAPGARTQGRLYSGVDAATLALLDRFEDDLYERRILEVLAQEGTRCPAHAYVVPASLAHHLLRRPWSVERFRARDYAGFLIMCRQFRLQQTGG